MPSDSNAERLPAFRWVAVVPVGPSAADLNRLDGLLESVVYFERDPGPVLLLNDGADAILLQRSLDRHRLKGSVIPTPRPGLGNPWLGRLTSGLAFAYTYIAEGFPGYHVLKLDTDALIIGPFEQRLAELVKQVPGAGMVGRWV